MIYDVDANVTLESADRAEPQGSTLVPATDQGPAAATAPSASAVRTAPNQESDASTAQDALARAPVVLQSLAPAPPPVGLMRLRSPPSAGAASTRPPPVAVPVGKSRHPDNAQAPPSRIDAPPPAASASGRPQGPAEIGTAPPSRNDAPPSAAHSTSRPQLPPDLEAANHGRSLEEINSTVSAIAGRLQGSVPSRREARRTTTAAPVTVPRTHAPSDERRGVATAAPEKRRRGATAASVPIPSVDIDQLFLPHGKRRHNSSSAH